MVNTIERISITIRVPALDDTYDFTVPDTMSVRTAQQLILRILHIELGIPDQQTDAILFDVSDGTVLRPECSFAQLGISTGAKLLLL